MVDALADDHLLIASHRAHRDAQIGTKEEVYDDFDEEDDQERADQRGPFGAQEAEVLREFGVEGGHPEKRHVRLVAQNPQVDGVEHRHGQDSCQEAGDFELVVNRRGHHARSNPAEEGEEQRDGDGQAADDGHGGDGAPVATDPSQVRSAKLRIR